LPPRRSRLRPPLSSTGAESRSLYRFHDRRRLRCLWPPRRALRATLADKDLLAEADKAKLEITAVPGDVIEKLVADVDKTPPEIARKTGDLPK
jgi:hypothetical protein